MQNDGQEAVEMIGDAPEWTSSVDNQQQQSQEDTGVSKYMDDGLPPILLVKAMPRVATAQERMLVPVLNDGHREQTGQRQQQRSIEKASTKLAKVKMTKKVAAHETSRRKWKTNVARNESSGISQTSATMLFQCSCQLLRNQTLDYDVRAREMEERNAAQTREIDEWEKRIRSLKRELEEYADEQVDEATDMALVEDTHGSHEQMAKALPSSTAVFGTIETTALPPAVIAAEIKVQDELRNRRQKVKEFCRNIPGFIQSQESGHYF
ncbi:unnamed protein product [Peronospora farinosa]|uniref:Uncharacterized protein n=1 Tax=Peronospora farinosa TaxID=134698 RepID=A0AAV0TYN0_9STRA|nr:unnamed protein product [Peronospora farinosa]